MMSFSFVEHWVVMMLLMVGRASTQSPTFAPTFEPTAFTTPLSLSPDFQIPLALHQLVVVDTASSEVIRLKSYSKTTFNLKYYLNSAPTTGTLYQLSQVYSQYGYEPKAGVNVSGLTSSTMVTGSNNRVYYKRPSPDASTNQMWGSFTFKAVTNNGQQSYDGTVTLVPTSGALVGSDFLFSNEDWVITGNSVPATASFEPYSRGSLLNHYVVGMDDTINVPVGSTEDLSLWYFEAPVKFLGNIGIAYGGSLDFTLGAFSGDFSTNNGRDKSVVELVCETCDGPVGKGITLAYSIETLEASVNGVFTGEPKTISIPLVEGRGWKKDSQNSLVAWPSASQCDVIQVLSRLSKVRILGDWTNWYESVALDNVQIKNTKGQIPLCANAKPDASICTC